MYTLDLSKLEAKSYKNISDIGNKKVLLRTCLNVVTDTEGNMTDATRYHESFPLMQELANNAKAVVITAHLGRPKDNEPEFSFSKIAQQLEKDLGKTVKFITNLEEISRVESGVYMLENVRFFVGEDSKDETEKNNFTSALVNGMDVFVNDAFADYRKSVSTYQVAKKLPSYLGPVFLREVKELVSLNTAKKPFVAILGGSKLSEKLDAMLSLLETADKVLVGGAMRYTLFKAQGINVGKSLVENDKLEVAKQILEKYQNKLVLPLDHMIINDWKDPAIIGYQYTENNTVPDGYQAIDIGPRSIELFKKEIENANTIVRNGPMGVFERDTSAKGTLEIGKYIESNKNAYKLAGGGDSIAAINKLNLVGFNHISTGGGAMLSLLSYNEFPTLDIILSST